MSVIRKNMTISWFFGGTETNMICDVEVLSPGIGQIDCPECEGEGVWDCYPYDWNMKDGDKICKTCKGSGKWLVSAY